MKKCCAISLFFLLLPLLTISCMGSPGVESNPTALLKTEIGIPTVTPVPTSVPITETMGKMDTSGQGELVVHTAESGGGSVVTNQLQELNLARIAAEGSVLSVEDVSTGTVYLPYLEQDITVDGEAHAFDHVEDGFAYYINGSLIKTPIRMPHIEGREVVAVVNTATNSNGEVGFAVLNTEGNVEQLFLGLIFGGNDRVVISVVDNKYQISIQNKQGSFLVEDKANGDWELVEKVYNSCMDPELLAEIDEAFVKTTGETIPERMARFIAEGKIETMSSTFSDSRVLITDMLFLGSSTVSLEHLEGSKEGDKALCFFYAGYEHPEKKIPVVISFIRNGKYYPTTLGLFDGRESIGSNSTWVSDYDSMNQPLEWISSANGPKIGDIFRMQIFTFKGITSFDALEAADEGIYARKDAIEILLRALNTGFLERMNGEGFAHLFEELNAGKGDIGAFAQNVYWTGDLGGMK
jgi:hypothetical protein